MPTYVMKTVPIEAYQITPQNVQELSKWSGSEVIKRPVDGSICGLMSYAVNGNMMGQIGDYIIKTYRGEYYFCDKSTFERMYEEVK